MKSLFQSFLTLVALSIFSQTMFAQGDLPFVVTKVNPESEINCLSNPEIIGVNIQNWIPGITYTWSNNETDSIIEVKPLTTTTYSVTVGHPDFNQVQVKSFIVQVNNNPISTEPGHLSIGKEVCPGTDTEIEADGTGGHGLLTYKWQNGKTEKTITVQPTESTTYFYTVTDVCLTQQEGFVEIELEDQAPLISPDDHKIEFVCLNQELTVAPNMNEVSGGVGYGYKYSMGIGLNDNTPLTVQPEDGKVFSATVTDACGIQSNSIKIKINKIDPIIPILEEQQVCKGDEVEFTQNDDYQLYYWEDGQMYTTFKGIVNQDRDVSLIYFDECSDQHQITKRYIVDQVESNFEYTTYIGSNNVHLSGYPVQNASYSWYVNGVETSSLKDCEFETAPGLLNEVTLVTTNKNGCRSSITRNFVLRDGIDAPNAITPNGDGNNDVFRISLSEEVREFKIEIFNRWGQLIFKSNDPYFTWNGQDGNTENLTSFVYQISGISEEGKAFKKTGTITLIRMN